MTNKRLLKSAVDRKICGVCGGIAEYFDIDPTLVRVICAVVSVCSMGTGLLAYLICAVAMPQA